MAEILEKGSSPQLGGGDVNGHGYGPQSSLFPRLDLAAGFAQDPLTDWNNEITLFSDGHELRRKNESSIWMPPTNERLRASDNAGFKIHFGLIVQYKFLSLQGTVQVFFDKPPLEGLSVHFLLEELVLVASEGLRMVHGGVCTLDQSL